MLRVALWMQLHTAAAGVAMPLLLLLVEAVESTRQAIALGRLAPLTAGSIVRRRHLEALLALLLLVEQPAAVVGDVGRRQDATFKLRCNTHQSQHVTDTSNTHHHYALC